uniref:Uncharacterized protein n=1 Tax=CrAss-like virus sp. ctXt06 TaxID=2825837 RepID=A0A8S5V6S7_9CAUD|nr:MAG TPA: hypothetical protein [CrAss-like virus sp. ctXt06]
MNAPLTHQQLKNLSHATTKKVLAGEGLQLTSRVLVCLFTPKLYSNGDYNYFCQR